MSLEANNSAGKLPPASIPPEIQSRDVAVPCPFTQFAIPPTDRSLATLSSLAQSASELLTRLIQTAVDPFTDRIVCRVTKIRLVRVANGLQLTNKPVSSPGPLERFCQDRIVYIDQSKSTGNVFTNSKIKQNLSRGPGELTGLFVNGRSLATLAGPILVTRHTMRLVNGSTAVWTSLIRNLEADQARDESIASERSVGGIANQVNGHGTATSLL